MSAPQFDIVFRGVRAGFDPALVKGQFASLFKLDPARVERIFKSQRVTLKNNADERLANIFVARLFAIGVLADKLPVEIIPSKAIYTEDRGEVSGESNSMHQPVDFIYGELIRRIPFEFNGTGLGYCKVWLVNLLVCLLSAGVLYPWARVRTLRYFYENTRLDGEAFSYTSNPQKIFLVQFAFVIYAAALCYAFFNSLWLGLLGVVILLVAFPYYWVLRNQFQLNHAFYCDTHFQKIMNLREAYEVLLVLPLVALITFGVAVPYVVYRIQKYRAESISIGGYEFSFSAPLKPYLALLPSLLIAECLTALSYYYREYLPTIFWLLLLIGVWLLVFIRWRVALVNLQLGFISSKLGNFVSTWDITSYNALVTKNILLCVVTLGLYWPWAKINNAKYKAQHLAFFANQRFRKWRRKQSTFIYSLP